MTSTKMPMSTSYKAVFALSILMIFLVIIGGAISGSKSVGLGVWIWGYTAWLMFKRKNTELVSFYKLLLWFDVIAAGVVVSILSFSDSDVTRYVGYTPTEAILLFVFVISLTYGLYKYFVNLESNTTTSAAPLNSKPSSFTASVQASKSQPLNDEIYYERALEEFDTNRRKGLWIKLLTQNEGDEVKSKFQYIKARAQEIQAEDAEVEQQSESARYQALLVENERNDGLEIIACRKCSQRIRVENKTGMVECPSCSHSWLFEKKESVDFTSASKSNDSNLKTNNSASFGEIILSFISWSVMIFVIGIPFVAILFFWLG